MDKHVTTMPKEGITSDARDLIQIRRGNQADLPILAQGEQGVTLDTERLYIGGLNGNIEFQSGKAIEDELEAFKKKVRLSLKDYGAVGDGVTDDSSAFAAWLTALDSSENIGYVPPGNYLIKSSSTTPTGVIIEGAGTRSTLTFETQGLIVSDNTVIRDLQIGTKATDSTGIQLKGSRSIARNVTLVSSAPNATWNVGVAIDGSFTIIDNVNVIASSSTSIGIIIQATANHTTINNCYLMNGGTTGISITAGAENCYINNTRINAYVTGINSSGSYSTITNNRVYSALKNALISAGAYSLIANNHIIMSTTPASDPIPVIISAHNNVIRGNVVVGIDNAPSIYINANYTFLFSNDCSKGTGLLFDNAMACSAYGNRGLYTFEANAIRLQQTDRNTITFRASADVPSGGSNLVKVPIPKTIANWKTKPSFILATPDFHPIIARPYITASTADELALNIYKSDGTPAPGVWSVYVTLYYNYS